MKSKRKLYQESQSGYLNVRITGNKENTLFLVKIDDKMLTADCSIENVLQQENFQYKIECIEVINNKEVAIDSIPHTLNYEEYSDTRKTAMFNFSWERAFNGFICIEVNNQYLM